MKASISIWMDRNAGRQRIYSEERCGKHVGQRSCSVFVVQQSDQGPNLFRIRSDRLHTYGA